MNIVVDIGNSRVKMAVMSGGDLVVGASFESFDASAQEVVEQWVTTYGADRSIVSSTRGDQSSVVEYLRRVVGHSMLFDAQTRVPIRNSYSTPHTLGRDRLAAAVGAQCLCSGDDYLIVDFGTAITIDLVTREGGFEGGFISPGIAMRFAALYNHTASLPLCAATELVDGVARTTRAAIEQGVMQGVCNEVEGYIAKMMQKYDKIVVIFAGGDAKYFDKQIKNAIFAECDLVIAGLNEILMYND